MRKKQVVVIGSGDEDRHLSAAFDIGKYVANNGWILITGGKGGIMEEASKGASLNGGIVIGIIPDDDPDNANKYCTIVIPTGIGYARNLTNILSGDAVVSVSGKSGTLSELAFAWQFRRPVIACKFTGGWSEKITAEPIDDRPGSRIYPAESIEEVYNYLDDLLK